VNDFIEVYGYRVRGVNNHCCTNNFLVVYFKIHGGFKKMYHLYIVGRNYLMIPVNGEQFIVKFKNRDELGYMLESYLML
jgi:hypothetical protein